MTHELTRDKTKCVGCGNCEDIIPGLTDILNGQGSLIISDSNLHRMESVIHKSLEHCYLDALVLKKI